MKKLQKYRYNLSLDNTKPVIHSRTAQKVLCYGVARKDMTGWGKGFDPSYIIMSTFVTGIIKDDANVSIELDIDQAKQLVKSINSFIRQCEKENA